MGAPPQNVRESLSNASNGQIDHTEYGASSEPTDNPPLDISSDNISSDENNPTPSSMGMDPRQTVGKTMHVFSDLVNENLIAARYAALASIGLLAAYGIS